MIDFWADWCSWCHRLDQTTYVDPVVVKLSEDFIPVKVDTEGGRKNQEIALRYNVATLPTITFITPGGRPDPDLEGLPGAGAVPAHHGDGARRGGAHHGLGDRARPRPAGPRARCSASACTCSSRSSTRTAATLLYRAAALDRERPVKDRKQARMLIGIIQNYDRKYAEGGDGPEGGARASGPSPSTTPRCCSCWPASTWPGTRRTRRASCCARCVDEHPDSSVAPKARDLLKSLERDRK